jgi:hypothetical protein
VESAADGLSDWDDWRAAAVDGAACGSIRAVAAGRVASVSCSSALCRPLRTASAIVAAMRTNRITTIRDVLVSNFMMPVSSVRNAPQQFRCSIARESKIRPLTAPALKILALSFLVTIGVTIIMEGFHQHVPKAYIYLPMGFALAVELLQMRYSRNRKLLRKTVGGE